jgi:2-dehydro-3-deoxyphosphogluconate aldolase/(4S)-4-hydroxy-2-oxoglutarate aldolase
MDTFERIATYRVIPIVTLEDPEKILPLADTLTECGLPLAEITFRTEAGIEAIKLLGKHRPDFLTGAGTLLTPDQVNMASDHGAKFGVSPGFKEQVIQAALDTGFPFAPGILTPSEVEAALDMNITVLKFFPAEASGGAGLLRSMSAPYAHLGLRFIPTGGINTGNLQSYLDLPQVLACGGSWIASRDDISAGNWDRICSRCRDITGKKSNPE